MKVVAKIKVEEVEKFQKQGMKLKYVNLRTAQDLYGDVVYEDCGTHVYVAFETGEIDALLKSALAHI